MTSFAHDIVVEFTASQRMCMAAQGVHLANYQYMADASGDTVFADHANARDVFARLSGAETPRMPPGGPFWTSDQLSKFAAWMNEGFAT